MSPEVPNQEKLSTPEQAHWLFDFLKSRLGDQPSGESKFYRLDDERFANAFLWDIPPCTCYGIAIQYRDYLNKDNSNEGIYEVAADSVVRYIDIPDPDYPGEWMSQEVKPSQDEIAKLINGFERDIEVSREVLVAELEECERKLHG